MRGSRQSALEGAAAHPCEQGSSRELRLRETGYVPWVRGCFSETRESPPRLAIRFATRSDGSRIHGSSAPTRLRCLQFVPR